MKNQSIKTMKHRCYLGCPIRPCDQKSHLGMFEGCVSLSAKGHSHSKGSNPANNSLPACLEKGPDDHQEANHTQHTEYSSRESRRYTQDNSVSDPNTVHPCPGESAFSSHGTVRGYDEVQGGVGVSLEPVNLEAGKDSSG